MKKTWKFAFKHELWFTRRVQTFSMSSKNSRISYIFAVSVWILLLSTVVIMYHRITEMNIWSPATNHWIDTSYTNIRYILGVLLVVSISNLIFREIRHSEVMSNAIIRRFLPIVRFLVTATIWIIWFFSLLSELHVNTSNILAGAWIWWVIFAFAWKDIVTNLFWSLSILLGRTFDIWETIRLNPSKWWPYTWVVEEITLNYTKITSEKWEVVFIPNRIIYSEIIENVTRERFKTYEYIIPFKKAWGNPSDIRKQMKIIEWKVYEYSPIKVDWTMENSNAVDYVYHIFVRLPDEDDDFNREMREFLIDFIFPETKKEI